MSALRRAPGGAGRPSGSNTPNRPGGPSRPNAPTASGPRAIFDKSRRIEEFSSADDKCPQCKTDRYLNPRLRLLVSPCYHKMCESCIDRIFSLGPAPCPECGKKVSKNQFTAQTFQDLGVEREVAVRRTVAKLFNRREEDFVDLKAYNDYLEEVEEITFNLIHEIDLPRTNAKLEQYQAAHRSAIASSAPTRSAPRSTAKVSTAAASLAPRRPCPASQARLSWARSPSRPRPWPGCWASP